MKNPSWKSLVSRVAYFMAFHPDPATDIDRTLHEVVRAGGKKEPSEKDYLAAVQEALASQEDLSGIVGPGAPEDGLVREFLEVLKGKMENSEDRDLPKAVPSLEERENNPMYQSTFKSQRTIREILDSEEAAKGFRTLAAVGTVNDPYASLYGIDGLWTEFFIQQEGHAYRLRVYFNNPNDADRATERGEALKRKILGLFDGR